MYNCHVSKHNLIGEKMKAILFDVYGTLISTGNGSVNAAAEILKKAILRKILKSFMQTGKSFTKETCRV